MHVYVYIYVIQTLGIHKRFMAMMLNKILYFFPSEGRVMFQTGLKTLMQSRPITLIAQTLAVKSM